MCAIAYVLIVEELRAVAVAHIQAVATAVALGARTEVPSWFDMRDKVNEALAAPPAKVDVEREAMLIAVGLRK